MQTPSATTAVPPAPSMLNVWKSRRSRQTSGGRLDNVKRDQKSLDQYKQNNSPLLHLCTVNCTAFRACSAMGKFSFWMYEQFCDTIVLASWIMNRQQTPKLEFGHIFMEDS